MSEPGGRDAGHGRVDACILVTASARLAWQVMLQLKSRGDPPKVFVVGRGEAKLLRLSNNCDGFQPSDLRSTRDGRQDLAARIGALRKSYPNAVVIPVDFAAALAVGDGAAELSSPCFPNIGSQKLLLLNNKFSFNQLCVALGVPAPSSVLLANKKAIDFASLAKTLGLPFVVKPTDLLGGMGVVVVQTREQLQTLVVANPAYPDRELVAQSFAKGVDCGVSVLARDGLVETASVHVYDGASIRFVAHDAMIAAARRIAGRLALNGVLEIDGRLDPDSGAFLFIEANPRVWGSMQAAYWCGLDYAWAFVGSALGAPVAESAPLQAGEFPGWRSLGLKFLGGYFGSTALTPRQCAFLKRRWRDPFMIGIAVIYVRRFMLTALPALRHLFHRSANKR
jgi:hypothetical protein